MPSPFPGMDPYLEDPQSWPGVHHQLISWISYALVEQLRGKYGVRIEERVYVSSEDDPGRRVIAPDVTVNRDTASPNPTTVATTTSVAVDEAVEAVTLLDEEVHEARIVILDKQNQRVITAIEVLSPANKIPHADGWESYQAKRKEVLHSTSHLVEIDLLRTGKAWVSSPRLAGCQYHVHVSRAGRRPKGTLWPMRLDRKLAVISIPLSEPDPDANLDLRAVLDEVYDRGGYAEQIDYGKPPVPPLPPELAVWADALLKEQGLFTLE